MMVLRTKFLFVGREFLQAIQIKFLYLFGTYACQKLVVPPQRCLLPFLLKIDNLTYSCIVHLQRAAKTTYPKFRSLVTCGEGVRHPTTPVQG